MEVALLSVQLLCLVSGLAWNSSVSDHDFHEVFVGPNSKGSVPELTLAGFHLGSGGSSRPQRGESAGGVPAWS